MKKLKVGIVGCGRISSVYKSSFISCSDIIEVKYAVDKDIDRASEFAKEFNCQYSQNFEDILTQEIDVVHVCTPHFLHKEQVVKLLKNGFDVLTEKPMGIALEEADEMIRTSKETGRRLGVIFQNRYIEGVIEAKKIIESGKIGKVVGAWSLLTWFRPPSYYECDWKGSWAKEGGGVLIDQAIHSIDLVQHLVGSPIDWIEGRIENRVLKNIEVEDVADAVIGFKNGCVYSLFACNYYTTNAPIQIEIMGEKGKVNIKGFEVTIEIDNKSYLVKADPTTDIQGSQGYWGVYHTNQIRDYYNSIINNLPISIDGNEGRKALEIVLGVYKSSKEQKKIFFQ